MSIKSCMPSMKVKENLEMEEQLRLVEAVLCNLINATGFRKRDNFGKLSGDMVS